MRQRLRRDRVETARRIVERPSERDAHRPAQKARSELADAFGLVAVRRVALAADEPRADGDVGLARADELQQPAQLDDGMLAVGVDAAAEGVVVLERPGIAGGDAGLEAAVLAEREHLGAVLAGDARGPVGRAVVDDEDVDVRQLPVELIEHGRADCPPRSRPG